MGYDVFFGIKENVLAIRVYDGDGASGMFGMKACNSFFTTWICYLWMPTLHLQLMIVQ